MDRVSSPPSPARRRRRSGSEASERLRDPLVAATYAFLIIALIFGGGPGDFGVATSLVGVSGLVLLTIAILRGGLAKFGEQPTLIQWAVGLSVALPFMQLVPLPWELWTQLPGHAQRAEILTEIGMAGAWQPLTMALAETAYSAVVALIMFGFLIAMLLLQPADIRRLLLIVLAVMGVGAAIGVIQFATNAPLLQFHRVAHRDAAIGFFANKNHMSLALVCLVPIVYELWIRGARERMRQPTYLGLFAAVLIPLVVATNSRAGLLLALVALFICVLQIYRGKKWHLTAGVGVAATVLTILVLAVPNVRDMVDRFGDTQSYGRLEILTHSLPLAERFWAFGSGIGSFPMVYESMEKLAWVFPFTVNHAHNDYLEIVIEAGIPGALVAVLNILAAGFATFSWLRRRNTAQGERRDELNLMGAGALIIALFAVHSFVDYPVRRVGTLAILMIALALAYRPLPWLRRMR